jgi:hypothetical protein
VSADARYFSAVALLWLILARVQEPGVLRAFSVVMSCLAGVIAIVDMWGHR